MHIPSMEEIARHQSANAVEQEHLEVLNPTLGPLYHALFNEVTWLHAKWLEYRKLYARSEFRVDLLNKSGSFFFGLIQKVLWEDVLLHVARLTDPPEQGKNKNLSLRCLPSAVPDPDLSDEVSCLLQIALNRSSFARDWRNKRLAHTDLVIATPNQGASPLPAVSRQHVEDVLASFRAIMNLICTRYLNAEMAFNHFIAHDDAELVVHHLAVALQAEERRKTRARAGLAGPEDWKLPKTE